MRTDVSRSLTNSPQFAGISAGSNAGVCTENYIRIDLMVESRLLALERQKLGRQPRSRQVE
jgi:hypothetical protein